MSELHTYRVVRSEGFGLPRDVFDVKAFTAKDAVTQMEQSGFRVHKVEPLPDSPPARVTIPIGGLNAPEQAEFGIARAVAPEDRADALEAELRERTGERDGAREGRARLSAALDEIAAVVWPRLPPNGYTFTPAQLVEAVRAMGAEHRESAAQFGQRISEVGEERDALQKRLDAAKAWVGEIYLGEPARGKFLAILEGREPGAAQPGVCGEVLSDSDALLEQAWGIISNASGGDWTKQSSGWRETASRWRVRWLEDLLAQRRGPKT